MEYREQTIQSAKITAPRIKKIFPRERLLRRLQRQEGSAMIWISAPAGSGKTTLAADYLAKGKLNSIWFQMDSGDEDPATFFHYLGLAVETCCPACSPPMPRLTPGQLSGLEAFTRHYFKTLFLRLKPPAVLVFDNFQELPAAAPLLTPFGEAFANIPAGFQILILSRSEPPAWFSALRARQTAVMIGWDELRLTASECQGIANLFESSHQRKYPSRVMETLHQQTRGWVAGLILMLQAIENEDVAMDAVTGCARETIFNYFASELFDKADAEEQMFLLKSALLPAMSLPAVTRFTDHRHAETIFRHLHRRNYFVTRRGGKEQLYEYHPMFREFLLVRGREKWSATRLKEIRQQAAEALLASAQTEDAIELLLQAAEWKRASEAILDQAPSLLFQGRLQTLKAWLDQIPTQVTGNSPWLLYWQGVTRAGRDTGDDERFFNAAFPLFAKQNDIAGMYLTMADAIDAIWISRRDYYRIDPWLKRFEHLYPAQPIPAGEVEAKVIASLLMGIYYRRPCHHLAIPLIEHAERIWNCCPNPALRWQLGTAIAPFLFGRGELLRWTDTVGIFGPSPSGEEIPPRAALNRSLFIAFGELSRGNYQRSLEHVDRGLKLSRKSGIFLLDGWLLTIGICNHLSQADLPAADHCLETMRSMLSCEAATLDTALFQAMMSWRVLFDHDHSQALEYARAALELASAIGAVYPAAMCHYALAHTLFESGELERAYLHLRQATIPWHEDRHQHLLFQSTFSRACFQLRMGDRRGAISGLRQALAQGIRQGYGLPLWSRPELVEPLLRLALELEIEPAYVKRLIRQTNYFPQDPAAAPEQWPVAVRIHTLGSFSLEVNGKQLPGHARKHRPLELLKAIIAFGGEAVAQEKIMDALWPEACGDTALKSMHTTLHRLRKLLGVEESVILKDGCLTLDSRHVWVDIRHLFRILDRIARELESPSPDPDNIDRLTRTAERLYRGPFLGNEASRPWSIAPAERIRNRLIRTVLTLGHFWENRGDWKRAADCYLCGLELDPLTEVFYRHLMRAYFKQGNNADALATYERCRKVLASTLRVMPGQETVRLYQEIRAGTIKSPSPADTPGQ